MSTELKGGVCIIDDKLFTARMHVMGGLWGERGARLFIPEEILDCNLCV